MSSKLNPYLNFKNNARQAMEFYKNVFGGTLHTTTFKEGQMSSGTPEDNLIMHSVLEGPNDFTLMGSDTPDHMGEYKQGTNFSVSLSGDNEAELRGYWEKLAQGAMVAQPLVQAPWGDTFGMLTDQFGVPWMVNITAKR